MNLNPLHLPHDKDSLLPEDHHYHYRHGYFLIDVVDLRWSPRPRSEVLPEERCQRSLLYEDVRRARSCGLERDCCRHRYSS